MRTIRHFGETVGLAIGLFAECSSTWDTFARYFASERARTAKIRTGAVLDLPILTTRFHQDIVRNWGSLAARGQVRLRLTVARDLAGPTAAGKKSRWERQQDYRIQRLLEAGRLTIPFSGRGGNAWELRE